VGRARQGSALFELSDARGITGGQAAAAWSPSEQDRRKALFSYLGAGLQLLRLGQPGARLGHLVPIDRVNVLARRWPCGFSSRDVATYAGRAEEDAIDFKAALEMGSGKSLKTISATTVAWRLKALWPMRLSKSGMPCSCLSTSPIMRAANSLSDPQFDRNAGNLQRLFGWFCCGTYVLRETQEWFTRPRE
jgi:hypothetical protein